MINIAKTMAQFWVDVQLAGMYSLLGDIYPERRLRRHFKVLGNTYHHYIALALVE